MQLELFEELEDKTIDWGFDKGILPEVNPIAQWEKTLEEVYELKDAIENEDEDAAIDAIGDIIVTLIMQSWYWDVSLSEALSSAYGVISKRKGTMVDGVFVKEE